MRRIVAVLGILIVMAGLTASSATADPPAIKIRVGAQAERQANPASVRLEISYDCPVSAGDALVFASVIQRGEEFSPDTPFANGGARPPCTGEWETIVITLTYPGSGGGFPFALGAADAAASAVTVDGFDARERSVRIVE
jgi:hypothetical protein